ncbi:MAG: hypothetical protein R8G60_13145 [Roseovarius pacificus]|nr:hypothetical protein [Roseovarius pacificus]
MNDIFKLIQGRHDGVIPEGFRNSYIYVISSLLAYLAPPAALQHRTHELALELCEGWSEKKTKNTISSVMIRALEAEDGKTRILNGKIVDPRYWYNSENLCEFLNVSFDEMQAYDLRALIDEQRRVDNQRENWRNSKRNNRAKEPKTQEQREKDRIKVSVAWHPPVFDPDDLRLRPCWITGGEFRHGDYERVSHAFGR